jgi:hypothetical protein
VGCGGVNKSEEQRNERPVLRAKPKHCIFVFPMGKELKESRPGMVASWQGERDLISFCGRATARAQVSRIPRTTYSVSWKMGTSRGADPCS